MRLASAEAASAEEVSPLSRDVGETAAADVATSGRAVLRGCRLATGEGVAATAVGWASAGLLRRWGVAAGSREISGTGSLVARAIWGLVVVRRSAAVVAGAISAGVVSREGDGESAAAIVVRGVADGCATSRRSVGWAETSGVGLSVSARRASCGVSAGELVVGSASAREAIADAAVCRSTGAALARASTPAAGTAAGVGGAMSWLIFISEG
jgi:hypothetical protein